MHFCEQSEKDFLRVSVFTADTSYYDFYSGLTTYHSIIADKKVPISVIPISQKIGRKNTSKTNLSVSGLLKIGL